MSARPPTQVRIRKTLTGRVARAVGVLAILIAVGAVALAHPTPAWASAFISTAALLPLAMFVVGRYGSAGSRPAQYGFALCCGGYFLFFSFFSDSPYLEHLATSQAIEWLHEQLFPDATSRPLPSIRGSSSFGGGGAFDVASDDQNIALRDSVIQPILAQGAIVPMPSQQLDYYEAAGNFWLIGQSWWAVMIGWGGASLATFKSGNQPRRDNPTTDAKPKV